MRGSLLIFVLACNLAVSSQDSKTPNSSSPKAQSANSQSEDSNSAPHTPNLAPPRSDTVNAESLEAGESSSKDTQGDLTAPADDAKTHPQSSEMLKNEGAAIGNSDVAEFHPWDPHKAAKDIEVGDYYFKRKNYHAAESRYREALYYKDNDAIATFRLAVCLEKMNEFEDARQEFENYLKILPHGPQAEDAHKAIDRLKREAASAKPAQ